MVRMLIIAVLALFAVSRAQPGTRQYVRCACRASSRGFNWGTLEELRQALVDLDEERRDLIESSFTDPDITPAYIERELLGHAADHWEHCVNNFSHEECVNADTSLRIRASRRSTTFCNYNNNMKVDCSKVPMLATTDSDIIAGRAEVKYVPPATPAPAPKPKPAAPVPKPPAPASKPKPAAPKPAPAPPASKPVPPAPKPAPPVVESDDAAPKPAPPAVESDDDTETISEVPPPVKTPIPGITPASVPAVAPTPESEDDASSSEKSSTEAPDIEPVLSGTGDIEARRPVNEGCVAVEHLAGYRTQHRADLIRTVLCGRGFCATPNHALIVDGKWTSIKELCASGWECVRSRKLVNNLDVFRNRRAQVGEVTITPYDIRFPRAGVWAVQLIERMFCDVIYDHFIGVLATIGVVVACWARRLSLDQRNI